MVYEAGKQSMAWMETDYSKHFRWKRNGGWSFWARKELWLTRPSTLKKVCAHFCFRLNSRFQVYCDFHGHSRKKNVFMYGCSTAATIAASSSSSGELDSDIADSVRERIAELSSSDSTSSVDPSDIVEDPSYRVSVF